MSPDPVASEDLAHMISQPSSSPLLSLMIAGERESAAHLAALWQRHRTCHGLCLGRGVARAMMVTAAHLGAVDLVRSLASELGPELGDDRARWWIATAEQRAGDVVSARHTLGAASARELTGPSRRMIEQRMMFPLEEASLDANGRAVLSELEARVLARAPIVGFCAMSARPSWASWLLATAMALVFIAQRALLGPSPSVLATSGGMPIPLRAASRALTLLTYGFVHASVGHLAVNVVSLIALGRLMERRVGGRRFTLLFVASSALGGLFAHFTAPHATVLVGASGGVMGLVGASLSHTITNRALGRTPEGRVLLYTLSALTGLRLALDLWQHEVSGAAHLGGLLSGAILGGLAGCVRRPES